MNILEIGGHIGYFTTFFACSTGATGKVCVMEPGQKNLYYLKKNISFLPPNLQKNILLVEKGAGIENGLFDFFVDPITGQNNSFVKNFVGYLKNRKNQATPNAKLIFTKAEVIKLDDLVDNGSIFPDFVKIDVEGYEWEVIQGFQESIKKLRPILMIEIQANERKLFNFFKLLSYKVYNDKKEEIDDFPEFIMKSTPNIFFVPIEKDGF